MKVAEILKQKSQKNSKQIILNYQNIRELGFDQHFIYITTLCLSHNCIQHLDGIEQFIQLTTLSVHHNLIQSVNEFNKIKQPHLLKLINVHHNPFTVNPTYSTILLQKFRNLEQIDNQRLSKQHYQQYFHWIKTIGNLIIPYLIDNAISEQLVKELQLEIKKYDSNIFKMNQILYTYLVNHLFQNEYDFSQLRQKGFQIFLQLMKYIKENHKNNDLENCLVNQAISDQDTDLFEFQSNIIYRNQQLYQNFLQLNEILFEQEQFNFPYFPLNLDYILSIIDLLKTHCQRQNKYTIAKCQQTSLQSYRNHSVSNKENGPGTINKTQSSVSVGKYKNLTSKSILSSINQVNRKIDSNGMPIFIRIMGNLIKNQTLKSYSDVFKTLLNRKFNYIAFHKIEQLVEKNKISQMNESFKFLKLILPFNKIQRVLSPLIIEVKDEAFNIIVRLRRVYEARQWEKSEYYYEFNRKKLFFSLLLINQQQQYHKKQALLRLLLKQRKEPLKQHFSIWKIYSISQQFYDQVFPQTNNEIKSLASISTKDQIKKPPTKTILFQDSNTTIEQDVQKGQKPNSNNSQQGTTIYCEYVLLNDKKKKKKKKKKTTQKSKTTKKSNSSKCNICREYLDENGQIIEKKIK